MIDLDAGEDIIVTFTNSENPTEGTITIVKNSDGTDATFDFSSADGDLDAVSITTVGGTGSSAAITKNAGTYTITEDLLGGWQLSSLAIIGDVGNDSTVDILSRQAVLDVSVGDDITLIYRNEAEVTSPLSCSAQILSYNEIYPLARTNWTAIRNLPQFDPSLGTLLGVEVIGSVLISNTTSLESLDAASAVITGTMGGSGILTDTFGNQATAAVSEIAGVYNAAAFDGSMDFAGSSGVVFPSVQAGSVASYVLTGPQMLPYIGTGTIAFSMKGTGNTFGAGAANLLIYGRTDAAGTVSVKYCYEPSALQALLGNRLWIEDDNNGDAADGVVAPVGAGHVVTATASDGTTVYTSVTDANGIYTITVPANATYTVTTDLPAGVVDSPVLLSAGSDPTNNNDLNHDRLGTTVVMTTTDNLSIDFGFTTVSEGTITIVKQTDGVDATFTFSSADTDLNAVSISTSGGSGSSAAITKTAGAYTISEDVLASWNLTSISFSGDSDGGSSSSGSTATIDLDAGENITVTFNNAAASTNVSSGGILTVTKTISGVGSGPFDIEITGPSGYITTTQIDGGDVLTFTGLTGGIYTVTESTPAGWTTVYTATPGYSLGSSSVVSLTAASNIAPFTADISGQVFRDFNSDGLITDNGTITDIGVQGVIVTAYDPNGNVVGTAQVTDADGLYTIQTGGVSGPFRVVFTNLPDGYAPTTHGAQNGTSVQFVSSVADASGVNFGSNY
ncbi:MAG: choice-of-anchor E domain-containing protein [Caldilineaceae bacterium]